MGNISLVLCDEGCVGVECMGVGVGGRLKREGMYVYLQLIYVVIQQKPT